MKCLVYIKNIFDGSYKSSFPVLWIICSQQRQDLNFDLFYTSF